MIKSQYVQSILELLIEGEKDESDLKKQTEILNDSQYSYTGPGLIVTFSSSEAINKYKVDVDKILNGVKITSSDLALGAQANLFFENGIMSYLEIFSNSASYPARSLRDYCLSQEWLLGGGRIICHSESDDSRLK
jgi:hypothetical protein